MGSMETKMIVLLIIAVLLIILIVVAVKSSETCVEPFDLPDSGNFIDGVQLKKIVATSTAIDLVDNVMIGDRTMLDYLFPKGIVMMFMYKPFENDDWSTFSRGVTFRSSLSEEPKTLRIDTTMEQSWRVSDHISLTGTGGCWVQNNGSGRSGDTLNDISSMVVKRESPSIVQFPMANKEDEEGIDQYGTQITTDELVVPSFLMPFFGTEFVRLTVDKNAESIDVDGLKKYVIASGMKNKSVLTFSGKDTYTYPALTSNVPAKPLMIADSSIDVNNVSTASPPTNYPKTLNVIPTLMTLPEQSRQEFDHTHMEPLDGDYNKGVYMHSLDGVIHANKLTINDTDAIDLMYPVGTVLVFLNGIDLSKQWPGTKWEAIDGCYLGHDTEIGGTFGADTVTLFSKDHPYKIGKTSVSACSYSCGGADTVTCVKSLTVRNDLPHAVVRIYKRIA